MCELDLGQREPIEVLAASHVALEDGSGRRRPSCARSRPISSRGDDGLSSSLTESSVIAARPTRRRRRRGEAERRAAAAPRAAREGARRRDRCAARASPFRRHELRRAADAVHALLLRAPRRRAGGAPDPGAPRAQRAHRRQVEGAAGGPRARLRRAVGDVRGAEEAGRDGAAAEAQGAAGEGPQGAEVRDLRLHARPPARARRRGPPETAGPRAGTSRSTTACCSSGRTAT